MQASHLTLVANNTGAMTDNEIEYQRARRFFKRLRQQPFVAILVDADKDEVRMYLKGVTLNDGSLRRIRDLLDEVESNMKEPDGQVK